MTINWRERLQPVYEACYDRTRSMADISRMIGDLQLEADKGSTKIAWIPCSTRHPAPWQVVAVLNPLTGWRGVFPYNANAGGSWVLNDNGDFQPVKPEHCWYPIPEIP